MKEGSKEGSSLEVRRTRERGEGEGEREEKKEGEREKEWVSERFTEMLSVPFLLQDLS